MRATLLAERLNEALSADPRASEAEVFRSVLNAHPDERLTQSMLIDRDGRVVEYDGTQDASDLALAALAGRAKPSAASDIQGGVVRIQTERDGDQFAAVRVLPRTFDQGGVCFARRWSSPRLARHGGDHGVPACLDRRAHGRGGGPLCA